MFKAAAAFAFASVGLFAAPVQWAGNGHWYEVSSTFTNWTGAFNAAAGQTFMGMQGYLVTVTSLEENAFVHSLLAGKSLAWAAGTDSETEGVWKWVAGPENGTAFWDNGTTLTYARWNAGEPNNVGNEDYLLLNQFGAAQTWNDGPVSFSALYVIEYSPNTVVPEPSSLVLVGAAAVALATFRRRS